MSDGDISSRGEAESLAGITSNGPLDALIERVEQSGGPDRELDALIHFSTHERWVGIPISGPPTLIRKPDMETGLYMCIEGNDYCFGDTVPAYTASLDAAATLVPEGYGWTVGDKSPIPSVAWCEVEGLPWRAGYGWAVERRLISEAANPALALCAAAIRAFKAG